MTYECPRCQRDLLLLEWSDRDALIDPTNLREVAATVTHCALDHCYDRTHTGVPLGLPEKVRDALTPVVARHLSAVRPDWKDRTVDMTEEQTSAFVEDVLRVLQTMGAEALVR